MANTKFEFWLEKTNGELEKKWKSQFSQEYKPLTYTKGKKFVKILRDRGCWGFVSMVDGVHKSSPIKIGDLLMAAGYNSPAKHARGNIFDGSAMYSMYGPVYLK